jgi:hypothetical protein
MRAVLGHAIKRSRKTAAEPIGVGFKGPNELTLPTSSKPDPRLITLVRIALPSEGEGHTFESCRVRHLHQSALSRLTGCLSTLPRSHSDLRIRRIHTKDGRRP